MLRTVIAITALVIPALAPAQVYKCKDASGSTIYSQTACSASAATIEVKSSRPAKQSEGELANRQAVFQSTDRSDAGIAERNCVNTAESSIYRSSNERIASYRRQIGQLNAQLDSASNNLAGATWASGLNGRISVLEESISTEQQAADTRSEAARTRCAAARAAADQAITNRYAPKESN